MTAKNLYDPAVHAQETEAPPPALLVAGHYRERYGYAVYRPHGSGNWLITYTLEGHGLYRQPGLVVLRLGQLLQLRLPLSGQLGLLFACLGQLRHLLLAFGRQSIV